jgi:Ala-tRNA(Pro) deacylase
MFKVSEIMTAPPAVFTTELQRSVYGAFSALGIPFGRVDTDPGLTMEDCRYISASIGIDVVKTLFLCNRQQTEFYLYVTTDDKPFVTREFCGALGIPRVSFASAEKLWELTCVEVGATTMLSAILPQAAPVHLVMDRGVAAADWYACTDGTATCFVKIRTKDLLEKYIPAAGRSVTLI